MINLKWFWFIVVSATLSMGCHSNTSLSQALHYHHNDDYRTNVNLPPLNKSGNQDLTTNAYLTNQPPLLSPVDLTPPDRLTKPLHSPSMTKTH